MNDPFPYVSDHGSRHAFPGTLDGKKLLFAPRDSEMTEQEFFEERGWK